MFQLRYLRTLNSISAENNSTIIFPVPIDIMSNFMQFTQKQNQNQINPEQYHQFQQYQQYQQQHPPDKPIPPPPSTKTKPPPSQASFLQFGTIN